MKKMILISSVLLMVLLVSGLKAQTFTLQSNNFSGINAGDYVSPGFTDLDGDGLLDLLVGEQYGTITHYEQDEVNSLSFSLVTANWENINVGGYPIPHFTDLDGDGFLDLLCGTLSSGSGRVWHYEQDYTGAFILRTTTFAGVLVYGYSHPKTTDLDGDGLLDMIVGGNNGVLAHYEQNEVNSTSFTLVTSNFNGIDVGSISCPAFADLDGDGLLDMMVGEQNGTIYHYEQDEINSLFFTLVTGNWQGIDVVGRPNMAFKDIDGDQYLDLLVGERYGSLYHYESDFESPLDSLTVTVDVPNGGEEWNANLSYQIEWTTPDNSGVTSDSVFYSIDNGSNWIFVTSHTGNPQSCDWIIPNTPSEFCLIKVIVYDDLNNSAVDVSDAVFTILPDAFPPTVEIIFPNGGESLMVSESYQIQWISTDTEDVTSDSVFYSIDYGSNWIFIASHTGNPQSCEWIVPDTLSEFCLIKVVVYDDDNNSAVDVSDAVFAIIPYTAPPTIEVISPNGGETLTVGETFQIQWIAEDNVGVEGGNIYYSTYNGANWTLIESYTGNPQTYDWLIPNTTSSNCLVKVEVYDADEIFAEDVSDAVFIITADTSYPTVEIISPNGGENWEVFEWHQITWIADDDVGVVGDSIFFSVNNGTDWTLMTTHTGNPQNYYWQIQNIPSNECLIKIVAYDLSSNCTEDISDGTFIINYDEPPQPDYAVVIKQSTYNDPDWQAVADALLNKYQGQLFIWNNSPDEVLNDVAAFEPTHIGFVCNIQTATPNFIQNNIWPFTRDLDDDVYCDAVWGIITGYNAGDALDNINGPIGFDIRTVLGGTEACDLEYYTQGIRTYEEIYNRYDVKYSDSNEIEEFTDGPTDRTEWLVTMLNEGIDIFDYNPVDIFYTNGQGYHNYWQLHYPLPGQEGYFRSFDGQVYGEPQTGSYINVNSDNPKIYFGLGNSSIGQIYSTGSMAPSWIHTGGANQYTGYLINEVADSYQHGATKAYFYKVARNNTWAEAYLLGNIALQYDLINETPGTNPPDLNGSVLYGDPGMQIKMSQQGEFKTPLFSSELIINEGTVRDTVTYRITMNREGNPGFTGKWGERHPAIILPFNTEDIEILDTDAMDVLIEDNFALMYIWHQGQPSLAAEETREVTFTSGQTGVEEQMIPETPKITLHQNYPNPFNPETTISFSVTQMSPFVTLEIFNIKGQKVRTLADEKLEAGLHQIVWNGTDENNKPVSSGIYFYKIQSGKFSDTKKMILMK